jgi:hypothetical protein
VTQGRTLCSAKSCGTGSDDLVEHKSIKAKLWSGSGLHVFAIIFSGLAFSPHQTFLLAFMD